MNRFRRLLLSCCLLASACATAPTFETGDAAPITPDEAVADIARARGAQVAWGGRIINTRNLKDTTEIEVLGYPLDESGRPDPGAAAQHRFVLVRPGYLESADYQPGRLVSAVGTITGTQEGMVGQASYVYPTLAADRLYLWPLYEPQPRGSNVHFGVGVGVIIH